MVLHSPFGTTVPSAMMYTYVYTHTYISLVYSMCLVEHSQRGQVSIGAAGFNLAVLRKSLLQLPFLIHCRGFIVSWLVNLFHR